MRLYIIPILLFLCNLSFGQSYQIRMLAYDPNGVTDTVYIKTNTDSLFRLVNGEYIYFKTQSVRNIVPAWQINGNIPGAGIQSDSSASINNRIAANLQRLLDSLSNHITKIDGKQPAGTYATGSGSASGTNTGDNAVNTTYESDYRAANFIAGTNYLSPSGNGSGLTGLTKSQVGLGNVDNTSDANKPVSTATQTALDGKQATLVSNTNIKTVNGTSLLGPGDIGVSGTSTATFVNLASNFSSTITTEATVTGWSFSVTTGKTYRIEIIASYQTAATTTGGELGFFLSASAVGTIRGFAQADIVSTAAATGLKQPITICTTADAAGSNLISSGVTAINSPHSFYAVVTFTCTTSGTFNVGWASEVGGSAAQLNANSTLIYQTIN